MHVLAVVRADLILVSDSNNNEQLFINLATVRADEYLLSRLRKAVDVSDNAATILNSEIFGIFEKRFNMTSALKYMVDENGEKTSVLVPLKTWEKINQDYHKLQNKLNVLTGIKDGLNEVREAKKSGKKLQTLKDFLRESHS